METIILLMTVFGFTGFALFTFNDWIKGEIPNYYKRQFENRVNSRKKSRPKLLKTSSER
jgi:hypothetical protein